MTPIGTNCKLIEDVGMAKRRAAKARVSGLRLVHGCCLSCDKCGDRPLSKMSLRAKAETGIAGKKRMAWQRYCALCQQVFTMNGFFAKHGTMKIAEERPLDQRSKKHKLALQALAQDNVALHSHSVDSIRMLDAEMRWLKLVKRFPHKMQCKTMTQKNIAKIPARKDDGQTNSGGAAGNFKDESEFRTAPLRHVIAHDSTDSFDISRMESLDKAYEGAEHARIKDQVIKEVMGADSITWDSDVVSMLDKDPPLRSKMQMRRDSIERERRSFNLPTRNMPSARSKRRVASMSPTGDEDVSVLDDTMRQLTNMSVGNETELLDTNAFGMETGMSFGDMPTIDTADMPELNESDMNVSMSMADSGALNFDSLSGFGDLPSTRGR